MPHPEDRRAKLVKLTAAGRTAAARADAILDEPPAALRDVPAKELTTVIKVLERLRKPTGDAGGRADDARRQS